MSNYNLSVKVSKGQAQAHAKYILAQGKYANKQSELELVGFGNLPKFAENDPLKFWRACEENERINGSRYREHVISLPRELNKDQRAELVKDWIDQQLGDKHAYTFAIHNTTAKDGKEHPHLHLMFSDRMNDEHERTEEQYFKRYNAKKPQNGGCKKANSGMTRAEMNEKLLKVREDFAELGNAHLRRAGQKATLDHRNWRERGDAEPPRNKKLYELQNEENLRKIYHENEEEITMIARKYNLKLEQEDAPTQTPDAPKNRSFGMSM